MTTPRKLASLLIASNAGLEVIGTLLKNVALQNKGLALKENTGTQAKAVVWRIRVTAVLGSFITRRWVGVL